jgi:predicted patatin/cPLA2 family phospholipase
VTDDRPLVTDDLTINVPDVALVFEGGGMRASYTAAVVATLLENGINFGWVAGISAGASNTVNYVSRDAWRARESFTDFAGDPNFGSWRTFVRGQGLFNAEYIYRRTSGPDEALPFAWDTFRRNPAEVAITALRCSDGEAVTWTRDDIASLQDLMAMVQASSTMPVVMPPVEIEGEFHVDGALGPSGGIALDAARAAGFTRFFVVLTQERGYRKSPVSNPWFYRRYFRRFPAVADALVTRHLRYNATREELFELERDSSAYLFVPETMPFGNSERNVARLTQSYALGRDQARRELAAWRDFLELA